MEMNRGRSSTALVAFVSCCSQQLKQSTAVAKSILRLLDSNNKILNRKQQARGKEKKKRQQIGKLLYRTTANNGRTLHRQTNSNINNVSFSLGEGRSFKKEGSRIFYYTLLRLSSKLKLNDYCSIVVFY